MLIDEAHLYPREADSMLGTFLEDSETSHVLGITATPIKLQANTGLDGQRFSKLTMLISSSKKGNIRVIFNVSVLSTGFDYTKIDCIILGISTASIALYYQILGRGTRIDDEKENCLISDLAGNVDRFGYVGDITFEKERIWKMYGTGGRLLSGIPIREIGTVKKGDAEKARNKYVVVRSVKEAIDILKWYLG